MITDVPFSVVENVHFLLRLSPLLDDYGDNDLERLFPEFVQALYDDDLVRASQMLYATADDFVGYGLSMLGNESAVEKFVDDWVFVDEGQVAVFRRVLEDTAELMDLREGLAGKGNRAEALGFAGYIGPRVSLLSRGDEARYGEYVAGARQHIEKLVRAEQRGVIN